MTVHKAIILGIAALALAGCKDDGKADTPAQAEAAAPEKASSKSGPTVYFVCQMNSDRVNYLSEMVEMTSPRTNEEMAAAFQTKVESLDRTYFPLPEGDTITYTCASDTDVRKMLDLSLELRGMNGGTVSTAFRSVTGWTP